MANPRTNQRYLGVDTNVLVAYLDKDHPSHKRTERLSHEPVALNPTIVHEAYHTLVFKMKWSRHEASRVLTEASADEHNLFINQTLRTSIMGLRIATRHELGGRDSLILANFLAGGIPELVTLDEELIALKKVAYGNRSLTIRTL